MPLLKENYKTYLKLNFKNLLMKFKRGIKAHTPINADEIVSKLAGYSSDYSFLITTSFEVTFRMFRLI